MDTPRRRTTRSQSHQRTPESVLSSHEVVSAQAKCSKRPIRQPKVSKTYGSKAITTVPTAMDQGLASQSAFDAIESGLLIAQQRQVQSASQLASIREEPVNKYSLAGGPREEGESDGDGTGGTPTKGRLSTSFGTEGAVASQTRWQKPEPQVGEQQTPSRSPSREQPPQSRQRQGRQRIEVRQSDRVAAWMGRAYSILYPASLLLTLTAMLLLLYPGILLYHNSIMYDTEETLKQPNQSPEPPNQSLELVNLRADVQALTSKYDAMATTMQQFQNIQISTPIIHKVNFFATGLGALLDPYLTSPTMDPFPRYIRFRWLPRFISAYLETSMRAIAPPGPLKALMPWTEVGDCWCAALSTGKAQIGVLLPRPIIPTQLVVDHIPRDATLDLSAVPQNLEFWAHIDDPEQREAVRFAGLRVWPEAEGGLVLQRGEQSLDPSWVRIGFWRYEIFGDDHVQRFDMQVNIGDYGAETTRVVVRSTSNWGGAMQRHTCFYRLMLHGLLVEADEVGYAVPEVYASI